ncbi:hypothetical protein [Paenibacillus cymbidii]|uniref:hypothetical protein n=1 Tax=Paenibacillus cymbidii TaxID=1639034 RepID=UPI001081BCEB|nr:hypothetical protein [Paenibacillus cymbidii]
MQATAPFKRGDSFLITADFTNNEGLTVSKDQLRSQVRTRYDKLIAELVITEKSANVFDLTCDDTTKWPTGNLYMDLQYTDDGEIVSTETILVPVEKDVTHDEP